MKIPEAQKMYREYRQRLIDQTNSLVRQRDEAKKNFETTGDSAFSDQAAVLQLSIDATQDKFRSNQDVLDGLMEQEVAIRNMEASRQMSDPETGYAATMSKIMTTAMRMSRGDNVPYNDEKKLLEADPDMYKIAKNSQMMMQQMKNHKAKNHDSLWKDEEGKEYDPDGKVAETEASGELPAIPDDDMGNADMEIAQEAVSV